jgi:hypothetical protein
VSTEQNILLAKLCGYEVEKVYPSGIIRLYCYELDKTIGNWNPRENAAQLMECVEAVRKLPDYSGCSTDECNDGLYFTFRLKREYNRSEPFTGIAPTLHGSLFEASVKVAQSKAALTDLVSQNNQ